MESGLQTNVMNLLEGAKWPMTKKDMAHSLMTDPRMIEEAVQHLCIQGAPICSGSRGYWLSHDPDEIEAQVEAFKRRMKSMGLRLNGHRQCLRDMRAKAQAKTGQQSLFT